MIFFLKDIVDYIQINVLFYFCNEINCSQLELIEDKSVLGFQWFSFIFEILYKWVMRQIIM